MGYHIVRYGTAKDFLIFNKADKKAKIVCRRRLALGGFYSKKFEEKEKEKKEGGGSF